MEHNLCSFWKPLFYGFGLIAGLILTNIGPGYCHHLFVPTSFLLLIDDRSKHTHTLIINPANTYNSPRLDYTTQGASSCYTLIPFNWCIIVPHRMIQINWCIILFQSKKKIGALLYFTHNLHVLG